MMMMDVDEERAGVAEDDGDLKRPVILTEKEMDVGAIGSKSDNFFSFSCDCFLLFCLLCHRSIPRSSFSHRIPWIFSSLFRVIASVFFLVFLKLIYSIIIFCPSHLITGALFWVAFPGFCGSYTWLVAYFQNSR
jgi:hypothetical protein